MAAQFFKAVVFHLPNSWPAERAEQLRLALESHGGKAASTIADATHIITNTDRFEGWHDVKDRISVVTDMWVERSIKLEKLQSTSHFSADPAMVFSGVTAHAAEDIPVNDAEVLSAGITALGGLWRNSLTVDVTHLFACSSTSPSYNVADGNRHDTSIKIVLPHWFDESVRLGRRIVDTSRFEWPDPPFLNPSQDSNKPTMRKSENLDPLKKALFQTAVAKEDFDVTTFSHKDVWKGSRILLSQHLGLSSHRRDAIEASIRNANGVVVGPSGNKDEQDELQYVDRCDLFVTKFRSGKAYFKAARARKTIGNLAWLFHVQSTGTVSRPVDELLHYPIPRKPIDKFSSHSISITNYTGDGRDYLKRLIEVMGATFTANMTGSNTVLIAAYLEGAKTEKAMSWSIPVVNHLWLEDCFVKWHNVTTAVEKYITFPDKLNFSRHLAEKGVPKIVEDLAQLDKEEADDLEYLASQANDAMATVISVDGDTSMDVESSRIVQETTPARDSSSPSKLRGLPLNTVTTPKRSSPRKHPKAVVEELPSTSTNNKRKHFDDDDDFIMSVDDDPMPTIDSSKRKGKRTVSTKTPAEDVLEIDDFVANMDVDEVTPVKPPRKAPKRSTAKVSKVSEDEFVELTEVEDEPPVKSTRISRMAPRKSDEPRKSGMGRPTKPGPGRRNPAVEVDSEDGVDDSMVVDEEPITRPKKAPRRSAAKIVEIKDDGKRDDKVSLDKVPIAGPSKPKAKHPRKSGKGSNKDMPPPPPPQHVSPQRIVSVDIPLTPKSSLSKLPSTPLRPATSISITAHEKASPAKPTPKPTPIASTSAGSPKVRRGAAARASQRLHDEIMPDVMKHQQELKTKPRRSIGNDISNKKRAADASDAEDTDSVRVVKKSRLSATAKGKQKAEEVSDEDDDVSVVQAPKKRANTARKSMGNDIPKKDDEVVAETAPNAKVKTETSSQPKKVIRMMTTQVTLPQSTLTTLQKLGVKIITRPSECTHLIVSHIVRTEKFLCALTAAPWILTERWALESVKAGKLLPEGEYVVKDEASEIKYGFKLKDALERAKELNGKLFDKMMFYITPSVPIDIKLLKNIITASGGQISRQTPTPRVLDKDSNRHVISAPEDENLCKPVVQAQYPVYSQELLLNAALKQEIEWDNEEFRLFTKAS